MMKSAWDKTLAPLNAAIMSPFTFNDLKITLIDAVSAYHESGWSAGRHRHPWFEFSYLSEGCMFTTMESVRFPAGPGNFLLVPPGVFHSNCGAEGRSDDGFCLRWQMERAPSGKSAFPQAREVIAALSVPQKASTPGGALMQTFLTGLGSVRGAAAAPLLAELILSLYECRRGQSGTEPPLQTRDNVLVGQAELYLNEYYTTRVDVRELAVSLNVSYRQLSRVFRRATGVTMVEKLNDIRINQAKRLLRDSDMPIREIASSVGFESEYYFSKIFSRLAFITPSRFRGRCRDDRRQ